MRTRSRSWPYKKQQNTAFTLTEVAVSLAVAGLIFAGVLYGYVATADHAEWSTYSLAAHSVAMQAVEQARSAQWDPQAWPMVDQLGVTNYTQVSTLDVPVSGGNITYATNYVSISAVSLNPPLRQLRADCVWMLANRGPRNRGPFTNTVVTLRAPDQ